MKLHCMWKTNITSKITAIDARGKNMIKSAIWNYLRFSMIPFSPNLHIQHISCISHNGANSLRRAQTKMLISRKYSLLLPKRIRLGRVM